MNARIIWALVAALLWAGQVQAWHAPTHIDDYGGPSVHQESSCILGVNGHGVALPPAAACHTPADAARIPLLPQPLFRTPSAGAILLPPLRGPPFSVGHR